MNEEGVPYNYFDMNRGWDHTNPGWYEIILNDVISFRHVKMVTWLYDRLDNPERHCRWIRFSDNSSAFKFRYERDYILFTLTWS